METLLIENLEEALKSARSIEGQIWTDPDTWDDELWDKAHKDFERSFLAAIRHALKEELISEGMLRGQQDS